ncbi:hypothetical protein [Adhaeribacter pallidiroseus]|uniref:Uncharacterized protein n=1 Tax=Adhaeribacter pallidiroseus TaxID=2072847 RepID=A0A369QCV4_9BACT|nr:hypothetical protein [Adhaeribacter pallidiroseus]RDC62170.1 hypothetical protein AHMF7616_00761 [Adhaeribacter pallidiroseus]
MKAKQTYLKGKSVFIVSLLVIGVTTSSVYLSGTSDNRSLTANLYWSLGIVATALFLFITTGLYLGVGVINDFPAFRSFKTGEFLANSGTIPELPDVEAGDGLAGVVLAILWWLGMTILCIILLLVVEAVFWFALFVLVAMLYWVFFRALKFVFSKSPRTKNKFAVSLLYALAYTILYTGWIFGVVYVSA